MDIISALSIAERPYQSSSYDFFSSSSSSSPLPSSSTTTSQQLLTKQDSKTNQLGSTAVGSDFRGHASSKKTPCYELKGDDLQKPQDDDEQDFMDSWDENTLRLEGCESDSILDEEMEQLSPIPFSELQSLTNIGLCNHGLVRLSSNIRLLASATCVQLIPAEIGFLRNLTLLDLSKNNLTNLPETITYLTKLVDLKLSCNQLESIPAGIGGLTKLAALSLDNNKLESIPPQIGLIKGLVSLDLSENPITVLPAEVGKLQFLRRLKLDQCPLIEEFSHSPLHSPPTLLELAARVIVRHDVPVPPMIVPHLKEYIKSAGTCSFCDGPYFDSWVKRGKMIEKNDIIIPLEYTLCQPHWNTEQERIKLLFCKRPITSPPPKIPTASSQQSKAESKTLSSSSSSSSSSPSSSSGPATLSSSGSSSSNAPNRSANRKYISENGARERPLSIIGSRFSFLKNSKGSSSGSSGSGSNSSRGGNGGRPISTYRTNSMPTVMSSTSTLVSSPSPLSSVSVYSSSASTSASTTSPSVFGSNNLDIATTTANNNNNNNVNNGNSTRPTVRRSVTSAIFARATSKLRRPLSMGPGLESAVVGLGLSAAEAGPAPAE
ncbi:hypothetical protein BGZ80_000114 [Entomortierella chlamydospora]|uniref:Disease resistance R13L4/SHOC-2-like LRR domain-containing protein n=1 Tax=Entomortierella chlamydospora TaxID=101097 RepID=A0A9P6MTW2_9FUNG|nr:hypothetical protein BGZ80_000114 [Entomortierella chlamydospora]